MNNQNIPKGKIPPQSLEAEQSLLGSLMLDKEAVVKVADFLKPQDFYKDKHQKIYQAAIDLFEKEEPIDLLAISNRLKEKNQLKEVGENSYLTKLVNSVPTAAHVLNYAKIIQRKRILRDLINASHEIAEIAHNEKEDVEVSLDKAEEKIFSVAQKSLTQKFLPVKDTLEEAFERIDNLSKSDKKTQGVPTGFPTLDNKLAGLQKSNLILLASRPSLGKSTLALDIAKHAAAYKKIPVGLFSLEMSIDQIVDRLIASEANVDLWRLRTGRLSGKGKDNDFQRIQHALGNLSEAPIFIDDAASSNILQMRAMARRLQAKEGLGLLIVDYLQLMEPRDTRATIVQQITEISRSLKALARELNVPVLALSQLSRAVEQRSRQIPRLADLRESGCLAGDTLITRADTGEKIPIEELVGKKGIPVHSLDKNWKLKEKKISKVFCSGKKMVYELKTRSGFKIKASANHPFLRVDGWKRLDQLSPRDRIATPRKLSLSDPQKQLSDKEIILLAHLIGDGCTVPHQPIHYTNSDQENLEIVSRLAEELFQIKTRLVRQKNWWHLYLPSPYHLAPGKHHPIVNWYQDLGLKLAHAWEKELPQAIFSLPKRSLQLFLKHLWATDGKLSEKRQKGRKDSADILYSTTSKKLAQGVKYLLLRLGIRSTISKVDQGDYRPGYDILIQGKENQLKFLHQIGSYGKRGEVTPHLIENLKKIESNPNLDIIPKKAWRVFIDPVRQERGLSWREFSKEIQTSYCGTTLFKSGIGLKRMTRIATSLESQKLLELANSDVFWDEIVSIKPLKVQKVYDMTVPGTHNFVANNMIVHNSLEQDADVVLFIHREDKYKPDTARKNIADIIIAKHRNGPVGKVELYFDAPRVTFRSIESQREEE